MKAQKYRRGALIVEAMNVGFDMEHAPDLCRWVEANGGDIADRPVGGFRVRSGGRSASVGGGEWVVLDPTDGFFVMGRGNFARLYSPVPDGGKDSVKDMRDEVDESPVAVDAPPLSEVTRARKREASGKGTENALSKSLRDVYGDELRDLFEKRLEWYASKVDGDAVREDEPDEDHAVCDRDGCGTRVPSPHVAPDGNVYCFPCCPAIYRELPLSEMRVVNFAECHEHGGKTQDVSGGACPLCRLRKAEARRLIVAPCNGDRVISWHAVSYAKMLSGLDTSEISNLGPQKEQEPGKPYAGPYECLGCPNCKEAT